MKKWLGIFLIALSAITFTGCSIDSTKATANVLSSAITAEYMYSEGKVVDYIDNKSLTDNDVETIIKALTIIDEERKALKFYKDDPKMLLTNITSVSYSHDRIKEAYLSIKEIIINNKELYTSVQLSTFTEFDRAVTVLNTHYETLEDSINTSENINTALALADLVIKIGGVAL